MVEPEAEIPAGEVVGAPGLGVKGESGESAVEVEQVEREILEAEPAAIAGVIGEDPENVRLAQLHLQTSFRGPLPPPEVLIRYNEAVPGGANRIMQMAESEVSHRHELEKDGLAAAVSEARLGQFLGFGIAFTAIVCGTLVLLITGSASGFAVILSAIVALVGVFVYDRRADEKRSKREQGIADGDD